MSPFDQQEILRQIGEALASQGLPVPPKVPLNRIPFSGKWGWATPVCFQMASAEKKSGLDIQVNQRAQELAEMVRDDLLRRGGFTQVEASKGYVNIFFETDQVAQELLQTVSSQGADYGRGPKRAERVMVEYSQPNTHKAFHVGHLRNVCLGRSLSQILDFAGFETIQANYLGDIGLHVIKCLWCYLRFHSGQEPDSGRGRWLGEIYAQAAGLLSQADEARNRALDFMGRLLRSDVPPADLGQKLALEFFQEVEKALSDPDITDEARSDLMSILRTFFLRQTPEFNEVAHRWIGEWMWCRWQDVGQALAASAAQASKDEDRRRALADLLEEHRSIGEDEESWFYARELRQLLRRWDARDPDLVQLWKKTRRWSLDDFDRIYQELGVEFEELFYESEVETSGKEIVEELIANGTALDQRPQGPVLVEIDKTLGLDKPTYRTIVILRSDGTSLYSTKDLSLAKVKFEKHKVDRSIYVVDVGQSLYFRQIFKVLELWGFPQAAKCHHLAYEIVKLPSGKMSSRAGSVVFYDDFFAEALRRARENVDLKRSHEQFAELPDLDQDQRSEVALAVALGAMKYGMLCVDNNKQIAFDFDSALSFEGQTAPYLQYAHARCCRILEKAGPERKPSADSRRAPIETAEINLLEAIAGLPSEVQRAAREYKPLYVAVYLYRLAKSFNDFYRDCPVLKADEATRSARLALVGATRQTLANGLGLLGIPSPRYM